MLTDLAAAEFEHGIYKQQLSAADAEISRAESELKAGREAADPEVEKACQDWTLSVHGTRGRMLENLSMDVIKGDEVQGNQGQGGGVGQEGRVPTGESQGDGMVVVE